MELDQLNELLKEPDSYEELKNAVMREKKFHFGEANWEENFKQHMLEYDIRTHKIYDTTTRPNKSITTDQGLTVIPVARIPVPYQKKIVRMASTFLCGNKVQISAKPSTSEETTMLAMMQKVWDDNKLDYESLQLCEEVLSITEGAELWYSEPAADDYWANTPLAGSKTKLRVMLLKAHPLWGDMLYPVFNARRDMIAFGRRYVLRINGEPVERFDLYTDKVNYLSTRTGEQGAASVWDVKQEPNLFGKIPVIYYHKLYSEYISEWHDVEPMIEQLEKSLSDHSDNNAYYGSPTMVVSGEILGFAKKGEAGKLIELENGATATYLESNTAPESIKLEQENLKSLIHDMSDTPPIDFEQIQGIGRLSGVALKLLFMGAHMKAARNETIIGKGFQRRLNFIKSALTRISVKLSPASALSIKPVFSYYLPKDDEAYVNMLSVATGGATTLSQKSAVALSPLVSDPDAELADIKKDGLNQQQNLPL